MADWGDPEMIGEFESSATPHKVTFQPLVVGQYMRLVALSEVSGNPWASAAEFEIKGCYHESTSTHESYDYQSLKAFPVPTQGIFEISLPSTELFEYSIFNGAGQLIEKGESQVGSDILRLDLSGFSDGVYVIRLVDGFGRRYFVKVVRG